MIAESSGSKPFIAKALTFLAVEAYDVDRGTENYPVSSIFLPPCAVSRKKKKSKAGVSL
jgi:hypothetical protein